jgi:hypothetical protein
VDDLPRGIQQNDVSLLADVGVVFKEDRDLAVSGDFPSLLVGKP